MMVLIKIATLIQLLYFNIHAMNTLVVANKRPITNINYLCFVQKNGLGEH